MKVINWIKKYVEEKVAEWRLFHIALHGSVLIESGHGLLSGGYVCDAVPSDQTVVEHDSAPLLGLRPLKTL